MPNGSYAGSWRSCPERRDAGRDRTRRRPGARPPRRPDPFHGGAAPRPRRRDRRAAVRARARARDPAGRGRPESALACREVELSGVNWLGDGPLPDGGIELEVKHRAQEPAVGARVQDADDGRARQLRRAAGRGRPGSGLRVLSGDESARRRLDRAGAARGRRLTAGAPHPRLSPAASAPDCRLWTQSSGPARAA